MHSPLHIARALSTICLFVFFFGTLSQAQQYSITRNGGQLICTDAAGTSGTLHIRQNGANICFDAGGGTFSFNGSTTRALPAEVPFKGVTSIVVNAGDGDDVVNVGTFTTALPSLTINGGRGDDGVHFTGDLVFARNASLNVDMQDDDVVPGLDHVEFLSGASLRLSGSGTATIKVSRHVQMLENSALVTENGHLTVEANQQYLPSSGNFRGITLANSVLACTGEGNLRVKGSGGNLLADNYGVHLIGKARITGGSVGTTLVQGTGGAAPGNFNYGVWMISGGVITSIGSNVHVTGQGGGLSASSGNTGVMLGNGSVVSAGNDGTVYITGMGGHSSGGGNKGVNVAGLAHITSSGGSVNVTGLGGGSGDAAGNVGLAVLNGGKITAQGHGTITLRGIGGHSAGDDNAGVLCKGTNSLVASTRGDVNITGEGGGSGRSKNNHGIWLHDDMRVFARGTGSLSSNGSGGGSAELLSSANIGVKISQGSEFRSEGTGTVSVQGKGGLSGGDENIGVLLTDVNSTIMSTGGQVRVVGQGGGSAASSGNIGVAVRNRGILSAGRSGAVAVQGTGGATHGNGNAGVHVSGAQTRITSEGGSVRVTGLADGRAQSAQNAGVLVDLAGQITAGGVGTLHVSGTGALAYGNNNPGVFLIGTGSSIFSAGGDVSVRGEGGGRGASQGNHGVMLLDGGNISASSEGAVTVSGQPGSSQAGDAWGIFVLRPESSITSSGGPVRINGTMGSISVSASNNMRP